MAAWPGTLPQQVSWVNYEGSPRDGRVRTNMDAGPPKMRRRYTAGIKTIKCGQEALTKTQISTLTTFYETTLSMGTLAFDWVDPITQAAASLRFAEKPVWHGAGSDAFNVTYSLEILP